MDLICLTCSEPFDMDYVLHEAPEDFHRKGAVITACPHCKGEKQPLSPSVQERLDEIKVLAQLMGNDIDGFATTLEDFGLV